MNVENMVPADLKWIGTFLDEDSIVADVVNRVTADETTIKVWLDPWSWKLPFTSAGRVDPTAPEHAGCLNWAGMTIRNFYGLWHADNPHTAFDKDHDDLLIEDDVVTDPRHPDNFSQRVIERVKAELEKVFQVADVGS